MTTFEPEKATQGELISFLDVVEKDARDIAASIARRSARHGPGPFGEAYYLGTYTPNLTQSSSVLELTRCHRIFGVTADNARSVRRRVRYEYLDLCSGQPDGRADEASQDEGFRLWQLARRDVNAADHIEWRYLRCWSC